MMRTLSVLLVCSVLLGCTTARQQRVAIEDLTLQDLEGFVNKHGDEVSALFGKPSSQHPAKHAVYWEYKKGQKLVVFLIRDIDGTVAGVNVGTDETEVYNKWASVWVESPEPILDKALDTSQ